MSRPTTPASERGETLLELLVAIAIIGIAVVALLGAVATAVRVSGVHRQQAIAGAELRAFEQRLRSLVASSPSGYVACALDTTYDGIYEPLDGRFEADVIDVQYWNGTTAFTTACTPDTGVQRVTLEVRTGDSGATPAQTVVERAVVVIRRPCRSAVQYPLDGSC